MVTRLLLFAFLTCLSCAADDGYRLWFPAEARKDEAARAFRHLAEKVRIETPATTNDPCLATALAELESGLQRGLAVTSKIDVAPSSTVAALGDEGFEITVAGNGLTLRANQGKGVLYGAFELLRRIQYGDTVQDLACVSTPAVPHRLLNHWDNLDGTVERGYAGRSLWDWTSLPEIASPRYEDYARACASVGINGTVLTNVNADARVLTPPYLEKVAALAGLFRRYGIRVYLTARFSAPMEIGSLKTADPLDPEVRRWWQAKTEEIYRLIPDFGGFLVKANSEGQPGPQDYHRTHADGANLFAEALAPHHGHVLWRAFVYSPDPKADRVTQPVREFEPLDGRFLPNVVLQVKNGPLDFMPREPFSPLFGKMPATTLGLELQITQEYLGQATQLCFLAPLWAEVFHADTWQFGKGSTIEKRLRSSRDSVISGVANTGSARNWTGHRLAQANWYAFGRLAWDPSLSPATLASEWTRLTFGRDATVNATLEQLLLMSREVVLNHSMPLGLHHIMAEGHHYGPGPWVSDLGRADWNSTYYHQADSRGLGADRTASGSGALAQYAPELQELWGSPATCPEEFLLWFHHVPWAKPLANGRTLWDNLALHYQKGVDGVREEIRLWNSLRGKIDSSTHAEVSRRFEKHLTDAMEWRDSCLLYFGTFSKLPLPAGVEPPAYPLDHYISRERNSKKTIH